jgi:predicted TIM-barrel fold metal-dependent hydrolase
MEYKVISADNHLVEPPHVFTDYLPPSLRDRAPRIIEGADGGEGWSFDGSPPKTTFGLMAAASKEYKLDRPGGMKFEELLPGHYDGAAHLKDMETDGIDASVIFPEAAVQAYVMPDRELGVACMRAYNDWLFSEFCAVDPERMLGLPVIPVGDAMDVAIAEIERVAALGARGVFLPGSPSVPYQDRSYDPLWSALVDHELAACFHRHRGGQHSKEILEDHHVARTVNLYFYSIRVLSNLIITGVFDRHPGLQVVAAEVNMGWMPFWLDMMEREYDLSQGWIELQQRRPKEYVGENVFVTVLDDNVGFRTIDETIASAAMYSTDYPHLAGIWPRSRELIPELTKDMPEAWTDQVLAGNAVRVFKLA